MYTLQALWTQARESLNITTMLFSNRSYEILRGVLANAHDGNPGRTALDLIEIGKPDLDWVSIARGMGMEAARVTDMDALNRHLDAALRSKGPYLIEVVL